MIRGFAIRLAAWQDRHGRHDLPWQREPTPWRVWVSEIMLQQTQVATVIPYFERFIARFPEVGALAAADPDEVLALWSGLGYYARARNLHRAAQHVVERHGGEVPQDLEGLTALPGIGRSTAAAILALSHDLPHPILDGNVRRVLARHAAVEGWPGQPAVTRTLWEIAESRMPKRGAAAYTQAIMDLGATVCTARNPACEACPVSGDCAARLEGRQNELPEPRPRRALPTRRCFMLLLEHEGGLLLERRPPSGIWGGLWSLPEVEDAKAAREWCRANLGGAPRRFRRLSAIRHGFTHFRLEAVPLAAEVDNPAGCVMEGGRWLWYKAGQTLPGGMPAPVARLLETLDTDRKFE